jgi:hypothetical protein
MFRKGLVDEFLVLTGDPVRQYITVYALLLNTGVTPEFALIPHPLRNIMMRGRSKSFCIDSTARLTVEFAFYRPKPEVLAGKAFTKEARQHILAGGLACSTLDDAIELHHLEPDGTTPPFGPGYHKAWMAYLRNLYGRSYPVGKSGLADDRNSEGADNKGDEGKPDSFVDPHDPDNWRWVE